MESKVFKIGVTGHRPHNLGVGHKDLNRIKLCVMHEFASLINTLNPEILITGMALGFDQWVAEFAIESNIPFLAYVPCEGQEEVWKEHSRKHYRYLLSKAQEIKLCSPGPYVPWKMHKRNKDICADSDQLIAVWNGLPDGGTAACVKLAQESGLVIHRIDPSVYA